MVKRVKQGREQHAVNFEAETYEWLGKFAEDNDLPEDKGTVIEDLCRFYRQMQVDYPAALKEAETHRRAREAAEELVGQLQEEVDELDSREKRLQIWEQQAAAAEKVPYLPVVAVKRILEEGMGVDDIAHVHKILVAGGLDPAEVTTALAEMGGVIPLIKRLRQEVESLSTQRTALAVAFENEQTQANDALAAAAAQVKAHQQEAGKAKQDALSTDKYIGQVREFAQRIEHTYRMLGVVLQGPIMQQMNAEKVARVEHMPAQALYFLAGSVIMIATEMFGDDVLSLSKSAENMVPIRIRLSEIPAWFAPAESYRPQVELVYQQMELMAQYRQAGNGEVREDAQG